MNKNIIKGALISAGMVALSVVPAFTVDNNCWNTTTGARSSNYCDNITKVKAKLNLANNAFVINSVTTKTNSGNNEQNKNTVGGESGIVTSPATSDAAVGTTGNVNDVLVDQTSNSGVALSGGNNITGYKSTNSVTLKNTKKINVSIENNATVTNNVYTKAVTGNNEQNMNTIAGGITTGAASSTVVVENGVNSNTVVITQ